MSPLEGSVHNRLTHTLKVAQVGRRLAEKLLKEQAPQAEALGGLEPDVVEAACLAHDLGHPPFGHIAEHQLDQLLVATHVPDGFNGNAQSFRIVTKLAVRKRDIPGLNLSWTTLNAVLKYPWHRGTSGKKSRSWGAYHTEGAEFAWCRQGVFSDERRSVEAELMDWADDVTYSVHDVEDFYRAGLLPLDRLLTDSEEIARFTKWVRASWREMGRDEAEIERAIAAFGVLTEFLSNTCPLIERFTGTTEQRADLRTFTAVLVRRYIFAIHLSEDPAARRVIFEQRYADEMEMLKQLIWYYIIENPALASQQHGQRKVISELFQTFLDAATGKSGVQRAILPVATLEELERAEEKKTEEEKHVEQVRVVVDLITGMTEEQALRWYGRLMGYSAGSVRDALVV